MKMLNVAQELLLVEKEEKNKERELALSERVPPLQLSGLSVQELQNLCKDLHHKIDVIDEERYDIGVKVSKNEKEIEEMTLKIIELKGKMKRPALKRVRISAEAMLGVLLGAKHKESIDFKANLKTVKKEEEKTKILKKASTLLEQEKNQKEIEREKILSERVPPLSLSGLSLQDLQNLCKELHRKIDVVDEERYDIEAKVAKSDTEIAELNHKIFELKGKMKRPTLKRVRVSADAMLGALLGSKHKESIDFKANLKTVKKEEEKREEVTDWRKNVDAMSGMEGRKKMFAGTAS
ncbi:Troponin I, cardiac muscle [Bagarius yarrelli]|uniref:Troponin I, cardiac muscle n=1 Tax=Bagarius yarrelli TaxID=175774 RepID=A0A556TNH0_BAGYA|nr:Troponin I, cardiac muscle [Bagarius yarrelli]